jgi:argininosuccinate lyase
MRLWDKGAPLDEAILRFTVGNDHVLDQELVLYDCMASKAHAAMLEKIGVLTAQEAAQLRACLDEIVALSGQGAFPITREDEDCHTAIENHLVKKCGEAGKKIHTARSRNDQVLTALRLYEKAQLREILGLVQELKAVLHGSAQAYASVPMPGYTHMRKATPTTVGMWLSSFADALDDDASLLGSALAIVDQSPLGTGPGYGIPVIPIDREMTAKEMGFARMQQNPIYAQMSRGKFEAMILAALAQAMLTLNKLATDLALFSMAEFGFVRLPDAFCTGSSAMPQKRNPDVLELVRGKYGVVVGAEQTVRAVCANLMSGFNRDMQLTKEPLFAGVETTKACLAIMALVVKGIAIDEARCKAAMTPELYATQEAYELVLQGVPFREAYRRVGAKFLGKGPAKG